MPIKPLMSWEPHPYYRWAKMYRKVRYKVSCDELKTARTKEASILAANEWWRRKQLEIDGQEQPPKTYEQEVADSLHDDIVSGRRTFEDAQSIAAALLTTDAFTAPIIQQGVTSFVESRAKDIDRSIKATAERFLELQRSGDPPMKAKSFREIKEFIETLYAEKGPLNPDHDVTVINEDRVEKVYLWLSRAALSAGTKKKRFTFFVRYVKHLWGKRLIELPRNLDSFGFKVQPKKIKTYTAPEVRNCLDGLKPRLRLYAILGLNCGMTNADIGQLAKNMIDLNKATLTRKRVKTADNENVPVVCYRLWPETLKLLRECWSEHDTLALTSKDNTPLYVMSIEEDGSVKQKDLILNQWRKKKRPIPLKAFRSISATLIESHATYGRLTSLFLGHSPRSLKEKHYAAPPQQLFDEAISWLREQILATNQT